MTNKISLLQLDNTPSIFRVEQLKRKREWMNNTPDSFAYRCMPLNIANENAWAVYNPSDFSVSWNGDERTEAVKVRMRGDEPYPYISSHFGSGTVTLSLDFVIKTPPGVSTYIRGIPNEHIEGLAPLDAIVETDWLPFTFTYNWQFKKPCTVSFAKDEPLFCFWPVDRSYAPSFEIEFDDMRNHREFKRQFKEYEHARTLNLISKRNNGWQQFYTDAKDPSGKDYGIDDHKKKIVLQKPKRKFL